MTTKPTGNPRGRPTHEPTDKSRRQIEGLVIAGYNEDQIAACVGIDPKTLRKHYRDELDTSMMRVLAQASTTVVRLALGAPAQYDDKGNKLRDEVHPTAWALRFLLLTKGHKLGWTERHREEDGDDADRGKMVIEIVGGLPPLLTATQPSNSTTGTQPLNQNGG